MREAVRVTVQYVMPSAPEHDAPGSPSQAVAAFRISLAGSAPGHDAPGSPSQTVAAFRISLAGSTPGHDAPGSPSQVVAAFRISLAGSAPGLDAPGSPSPHGAMLQATWPAARNGTSTWPPIGIVSGTVQGFLHSVILSRFGSSP